MLRVAHFVTHPIQYFTPLYREITKQGKIDLTVFYGSDFGSKPSYDPGLGRTVQFDVPLLGGYSHEFLSNRGDGKPGPKYRSFDCPDLISVINRKRYDALWIHGWGYRFQHQAARIARKEGIPYFLRGESTLLEAPLYSMRWFRRRLITRSILRHAAGCLYVGKNNRDFFLSMGLSQQRLFPAHYSIDAVAFQKRNESGQQSESVRGEFGCDADSVVLVTVAKLIERKRISDILVAMKSLPENVVLWVIGDGEDRDALREQSDATLKGRVSWLGFRNQSQIPSILAAADLFILASREETWGLVVNEAMACGLPCIVSDRVGCAADLINEGNTGYTFRCRDTLDLADKIRSAMADRSKWDQMRKAAQQLILNKYSVSVTADQIAYACKTLAV